MADSAQSRLDETERKRRSLKPLSRIFPYMSRYKGMLAGALASLKTRRRDDIDVTACSPAHDRSRLHRRQWCIHSQLLWNAGAPRRFAGGRSAAGRYYFVITLGQRIISDLRRDVFAHLTRLSPAFFDGTQSGAIVSRLTADTTQIKSAVGATASIALRNLILALGAIFMMVITSPKLSSLVIAAIPVIIIPLIAFGRSVRRRSRRATGYTCRCHSLCQRIHCICANIAGFHQ